MRRVAALLALVAAPAAADPLQDRVLAAMRATRTADLAFTMTTRAERTESAAKTFVARYDPRGGWTVASIDGRAPTAKEQKAAAKNRSPLPSYATLATWFGAPATRIATGAGSATYRFAHLPAGTVKFGGHDASAATIADAMIETAGGHPYVARVRFASTAPFRMMLVARVERFAVTSTYAPLADGRVFATGSDTEFAGSMLGKAGTLATQTRLTDVRPAR